MQAKALKSRQDARRQAIAAAATALIAEHGPEALRVKTLAASLGLTAGALYRYFPSKDHLLAEVEATVLGDIADCMKRVADAMPDDDALAPLAALVDAYALLSKHPSPHYLVLAHFIAPPRAVLDDQVAADVIPNVTRLFALMASAVGKARSAGLLDAGEDMQRAAMLWSALHGILERRKLTRFGLSALDIDVLYRQTAAALLTGWGLDRELAERLFAAEPTHLRPRYQDLIGALS